MVKWKVLFVPLLGHQWCFVAPPLVNVETPSLSHPGCDHDTCCGPGHLKSWVSSLENSKALLVVSNMLAYNWFYRFRPRQLKGYKHYHLHVFLSDKTQLIVEAMQLERQFLILLTQSSIFIKQRKKLTLCLPKTLQLIKANWLKAHTNNLYAPK